MAIVDVKKEKRPLTIGEFVNYGKAINWIYQDDEEGKAKAIGRYIDNVCRIEKR
jgi:uncharacterized protein YggL (DUF469 family)